MKRLQTLLIVASCCSLATAQDGPKLARAQGILAPDEEIERRAKEAIALYEERGEFLDKDKVAFLALTDHWNVEANADSNYVAGRIRCREKDLDLTIAGRRWLNEARPIFTWEQRVSIGDRDFLRYGTGSPFDTVKERGEDDDKDVNMTDSTKPRKPPFKYSKYVAFCDAYGQVVSIVLDPNSLAMKMKRHELLSSHGMFKSAKLLDDGRLQGVWSIGNKPGMYLQITFSAKHEGCPEEMVKRVKDPAKPNEEIEYYKLRSRWNVRWDSVSGVLVPVEMESVTYNYLTSVPKHEKRTKVQWAFDEDVDMDGVELDTYAGPLNSLSDWRDPFHRMFDVDLWQSHGNVAVRARMQAEQKN